MILAPFKPIARRRALKRYASPIKTGPVPLSRVRSAVVLVNPHMWYTAKAVERIEAFFKRRNIPVSVVAYGRSRLNWYGRLKSGRGKQPIGEEDLFISLRAEDDFAARFAAVSSRAMFKIGRRQLPGHVYDVLIAPEAGGEFDAEAIFRKLEDFLVKVK